MRVVTLVPSATELLAAVGGLGLLVGRSHACDAPPGVGGIPPATRPGAGGPDDAFQLDTGRLAELRPDVVVAGAGGRAVPERAVRAAVGGRPRVLTLGPRTIEDVLDGALQIGREVGLETNAKRTVVDLRSRLTHAQEFVNAYERGPAVGFVARAEGLYCAARWTVQVIERAGGRHPWNEAVARGHAGAAAGMQQGERVAGPSIAVPERLFAAVGPEVVLVAPRHGGLEEAVAAAETLLAQAWFAGLPAARAGRVLAADGRVFGRPGPRLVDAFEFLVGYLQRRPGLIPGGFPWAEVRA